MTVEAIVLRSGEGRALSLRGTGVAYKAEGERPAGGPTFLEFSVATGFNTGDHVHSRIEEIFYVVEGEVQIRVGDQLLRGTAGDFVLVPPGVAHGFASSGDGPAKMVLVISPGGVHEKYFEELAELLAKPGAPDADAIGSLRERFDTTQVSPLTTSSTD
jgi:quercetin dioxygenase-like cupin family protein